MVTTDWPLQNRPKPSHLVLDFLDLADDLKTDCARTARQDRFHSSARNGSGQVGNGGWLDIEAPIDFAKLVSLNLGAVAHQASKPTTHRACPRTIGATGEEDPVQIPDGHKARIEHARERQKFFNNRFPEAAEFIAFLQANPAFVFDEHSFYECSMAYCGGGSVSEGYGSDIDINAPLWFRTFERRTFSSQH